MTKTKREKKESDADINDIFAGTMICELCYDKRD